MTASASRSRCAAHLRHQPGEPNSGLLRLASGFGDPSEGWVKGDGDREKEADMVKMFGEPRSWVD